jgi:hypothetical protein
MFTNDLQPYFFSYADPSEKFWSLKSKPSVVKNFYVLTMIKLHSRLIFLYILLYKVHQNKSYIDLKTEIFHLGRHRKKNTTVEFIINFFVHLFVQPSHRPNFSLNEKITFNNIFWPANWDPKRQICDPNREIVGTRMFFILKKLIDSKFLEGFWGYMSR